MLVSNFFNFKSKIQDRKNSEHSFHFYLDKISSHQRRF